MKLIDDIKQAPKFLSIQLSVVLGAAASAYEFLPAVRDYLDPTWVKWIALAILVARVIKQREATNAG
jgi:hypothetical protein